MIISLKPMTGRILLKHLLYCLPIIYNIACTNMGSAELDFEPFTEQESSSLEFSRNVDPFPVLDEDGTTYHTPFSGGFNVPRPQFVDIDGDSDLDLFLQEQTDKLIFFENIGSSKEPAYSWRTDHYHEISIGEWSRFFDFDSDGDLDLLTEEPFSYIKYFQNIGTAASAAFLPASDSVRDIQNVPVFADRQNIPSINDLDCDGNWDLFLGRVEGTITRFEAPSDQQKDLPVFQFIENNFQGIEILGQFGSLHGANSMTFADSDQDGDLDFFWGDFFEPGVLYLENTGSCSTPLFLTEPSSIKPDNTEISTSGYNVPVLEDIDADGDLDLFLGVLGGAFNPNLSSIENFHFYENTDEGFVKQTTRFIYTLDLGSESIPTFADLDGDGDLDMLVTNKIDPKDNATSRMFHFENTGTKKNPIFHQRSHIPLFENYHYAPTLGDLDDDGDLDMLVGTWNKGIGLFKNQGTRSKPDFVLDESGWITLTRGSNSTPALHDIDHDGDLDLFVGESSGELNFYRNVGTAGDPSFELVSDRFADIDVGRRSFPTFADINGDGNAELFIGSETGEISMYREEFSTAALSFKHDPTFSLSLNNYSTPSLVDIDADGKLDVISGSISGGLIFYHGR